MSKREKVTPLYVKLPTRSGDAIERAATALGVAKKEIVHRLVERYLEPSTGAVPRKVTVDLGDPSPTLGSYSFQPYDPPEVMTSEQAGQFLQIDEALVLELADAGKLPGRKLGKVWRFSREALVAWLAAPDKERR
jgi:excisionase family DNA binding protein